jgi:actin-related protein 8
MKRDDQILALRLQAEASRDKLVQSHRDRDRALAKGGSADATLPLDDEVLAGPEVIEAAQIVVIHPGSQYLRIGLASDALPKTIPMAIAVRHASAESAGVPARPERVVSKRKKSTATREDGAEGEADGSDGDDDDDTGEDQDEPFGHEWTELFHKMSDDLRAEMRANKRKLPPNPKEQVLNYNRRSEPEIIAQHNDPLQIDWTDPRAPAAGGDGGGGNGPASYFVGAEAQRLPDDSDPTYRLYWPMQHGLPNEDSFSSREEMVNSLESILDRAIKVDLGIGVSQLSKYNCLFVIPDMYDKWYVEQLLRSATTWFQFNRVCFMQESLAATFGAGYTQACVVDVGAQKTSISCVEDGAVVEDSRVNLKYGGHDVTETFVKMMLHDRLPYRDMNLHRRYDWLLAEELKIRHCTMNQAQVSPGQPHSFHVRAPNQPTRKYQFKLFDEVILAPMGFYEPAIFGREDRKLRGRRKLVPLSVNTYDVDVPDDPMPAAQTAILAMTNPAIGAPRPATPQPQPQSSQNGGGGGGPGPLPGFPAAASSASLAAPDLGTPSKEKTQPFMFSLRYDMGGSSGTPSASKAPSPQPEGASTPMASLPFAFTAGSPAPSSNGGPPANGTNSSGGATGGGGPPTLAFRSAHFVPALDDPPAGPTPRDAAVERDAVLPLAPLDLAVLTSITHAARGDDKRTRDLLGSIMVVGGGAKIPMFTAVLEEKLRERAPPELADKILVSRSARDMDEQVVVWKGASVFAKLPTNDSWVTPHEVERLGSRALYQRLMFNW